MLVFTDSEPDTTPDKKPVAEKYGNITKQIISLKPYFSHRANSKKKKKIRQKLYLSS